MSTDQTERVGVEAARLRFAQLGWFCRESVSPDYGVDMFVETADAAGRPTERRDPWIDPTAAPADDIESAVNACPSGALGLRRSGPQTPQLD